MKRFLVGVIFMQLLYADGAAYATCGNGNIYIADAIHSRILGWAGHSHLATGQPPDMVLGYTSISAPVKFPPAVTARTFDFPSAIAISLDCSHLWVADGFDERIMAFPLNASGYPTNGNGEAADIIIGQPNSTSHGQTAPYDCNHAQGVCGPGGLRFNPYNGYMYVADGADIRIYAPPFTSGMSASWVIGADIHGNPTSFSGLIPPVLTRGSGHGFYENACRANDGSGIVSTNNDTYPVTQYSVCAPGLAFSEADTMAVADFSNNRVLMFQDDGNHNFDNGIGAYAVLGQVNFKTFEPNGGGGVGNVQNGSFYLPSDVFINPPGSIFVADFGNGRVMQWSDGSDAVGALTNGERAATVLGRDSFTQTVPTGTPATSNLDGCNSIRLDDTHMLSPVALIGDESYNLWTVDWGADRLTGLHASYTTGEGFFICMGTDSCTGQPVNYPSCQINAAKGLPDFTYQPSGIAIDFGFHVGD